MHIRNAVALAYLIGACSQNKPALPPVIPPGATACAITSAGRRRKVER